MKNRSEGLEARGLGDEGLHIAGACQHHSFNLSCGSRKLTNFEKEFFFLTDDAGMSMKTKDRCGKLWTKPGML
jgi:hypothetical protein